MGIKIDYPESVTAHIKYADYFMIGKSKEHFNSDKTTKKVNWDSFESVEMFFELEYTLVKIAENLIGQKEGSYGEGRFGFSTRWRATFTDSGLQLERDGVQPKPYGVKKHKGGIIVAATGQAEQSKTSATKPFVETAIQIVVSVLDPGINLSGGFLVGGFSRNILASQEHVTTAFERRIIFDIDNPPEDVEVKIPRSLTEPAAIFFKENEDILSAEGLKELHAWVSKVKDIEALNTVIVQGKLKIELEAFASTTGTDRTNQGKTDERLKSVKKTLMKSGYFGSSALDFDPQSHSSKKAVSRGPKDPWNRRVEIKIDRSKAIKAIKKLKEKK